MTDHQIVSHDDWIARGRFLANEKEFTRLREELSRERELPWECVKKEYVFEGENGGETLAHLFGGRSLDFNVWFAPETLARGEAVYNYGSEKVTGPSRRRQRVVGDR
jgi:predicted dithiol-disulfide oxidoreductase (DUF899 family)